MTQKKKIPIILYASDSDPLPYIELGPDEYMPKALFVQGWKQTGETEPGPEGEDLQIVDMTMHMYVEMEQLSESLSPEVYDIVRVALGMEPVAQAREKGLPILKNIATNIDKLNEQLVDKYLSTQREAVTAEEEKVPIFQLSLFDDDDDEGEN